MIITLDGPVASGKSTLAKLISKQNNFFYLYSGIFYRAYEYILLKMKINLNNEFEVRKNYKSVFFSYQNDINCNPVIIFENENIFELLKGEDIGKQASFISCLKFIREVVFDLQHQIANENKNIVADGRDCGLNVFKEAQFKFFITASLNERIKRISERNNRNLNESEILSFIIERDHKDTYRKIDPMYPANDSFLLNTTNLTLKETYNYFLKIIN